MIKMFTTNRLHKLKLIYCEGNIVVILKKKDKFTTFLSNISGNLKQATDYFVDYKLENISDLKVFTEVMKDYEHKGDAHVHGVITALNNAFITPIEREDILHLAVCMDDVLDELEHCGALFEMYSVVNADEYMLKLVDHIREAVYEIDLAVDLLSTKKLLNISQHAIKIKELESKCDGIHRQSIKNLFAVESDPIRIIQYKEIYESLEEIADNCQSVANTLETIIMKNA